MVRKYFPRYRKHILKERLATSLVLGGDSAEERGKRKRKKPQTIIDFSAFRAKHFQRIQRDVRELQTPVKAGLTSAHNLLDQRLLQENRALSEEIREYYDLLVSCQSELQSLRNDLYLQSHALTREMKSLNASAVKSSRTTYRASIDSDHPIAQGSPVFAGLENQTPSNTDMQLDHSMSYAQYFQERSLLSMKLVHNIVQDYVESTIKQAIVTSPAKMKR